MGSLESLIYNLWEELLQSVCDRGDAKSLQLCEIISITSTIIIPGNAVSD